jgi:hypothetical protein
LTRTALVWARAAGVSRRKARSARAATPGAPEPLRRHAGAESGFGGGRKFFITANTAINIRPEHVTQMQTRASRKCHSQRRINHMSSQPQKAIKKAANGGEKHTPYGVAEPYGKTFSGPDKECFATSLPGRFFTDTVPGGECMFGKDSGDKLGSLRMWFELEEGCAGCLNSGQRRRPGQCRRNLRELWPGLWPVAVQP